MTILVPNLKGKVASVRLTPIDLVNKRFPLSLRGYARAAVEDYLREAASDYEETVAENARLREQVEALEREVERYRTMETTLKEALILAQKTADETRAVARREADALLRDAHSRASALFEEAQGRVETLRQQRIRFAREFRVLLQVYLDSLETGLAQCDAPTEARPVDSAPSAVIAVPAPPADESGEREGEAGAAPVEGDGVH